MTAQLRRREIEINLAVQMKNLGFDVDMNEDGDFIYKKFPSEESTKVDLDEEIPTDKFAGTNIDASQLGQLQEQALMSGSTKQQVAGETEKMSVGPPKRFSGLPKEAANNNVDKRTERRVRSGRDWEVRY